MFVWQNAPTGLTMLCDSDWAGERKTRKSVSSGHIRFGHHLLRSWSKDQSTITLSSGKAELYAACMAAQQAMGTANMAREQGVNLDAVELHEDRTPRRTHIFLSLVGVPHLTALSTRTCVRVAQAQGSSQTGDMIGTCCIPARLLTSHPISQHASQNAPRRA